MQLIQIADGRFVNPDHIREVTVNGDGNSVLLTFSDGTSIEIPSWTFSRLQEKLRDDEAGRVTRGDIHRTIEALNRLASSIPHSLRVHY